MGKVVYFVAAASTQPGVRPERKDVAGMFRGRALFGYGLLFAVLLLGLVVAVAAYALVQRPGVPWRRVPRVEVVVAVADIPAGATIGPEMVATRSVEADGRSAAAAASVEEVVGKVAVAPVRAGERILLANICVPTREVGADEVRPADLVPPGRRALAVAFAEADGRGRAIEAGDAVDVVALLRRDATGLDEDATVVVASDVLVLTIAQDLAGDSTAQSPDGASDATAGAGATSSKAAETKPGPGRVLRRGLATLAVTPREAQLLALAQQNGDLRLVRRTPEEGRDGG